MEKENLLEKDLHCIARQIQSSWEAPKQETINTFRMFYGCWYCKFSHECQPPAKLYFRTALKKLEDLTGVVAFSPMSVPEHLERIFLPASVFLQYPEELQYLEKHHPDKYKDFKEYLDTLIAHSKEAPDLQQDSCSSGDNRTDICNHS